MQANKEITRLWQGFLAVGLFVAFACILWAFCTALIYYSLQLVNVPPLFRFLSAAGLPVLITSISIKFFGRLSPN